MITLFDLKRLIQSTVCTETNSMRSILVLSKWILWVSLFICVSSENQSVYQYFADTSQLTGLVAENRQFALNGKYIRIISGAIHYFRVHPEQWRDRLRKLRAMGANTVETYVSWNLHEPRMGEFDFGEGENDFSGFMNIRRFLQIAQEEDLLVILRPGPYICAEWEYGDEIGLIGDLTKPYCLPLMNGKHCDLTCISVHTMAKLLNGDYKQTVESYRIIDCRYPYEYNGGHIRGAENIFTHDDIMEVFLKEKTETASVALDEAMRNIVIFHCEFSSERGPKLLRFLRSKDREVNTSAYPALHYPEIYLLNDGYKEFFNSYSDLCDPKGYLPMLAPTHNSAYRHFRAETKTWNSSRRAGPSRSSKTRSRFVL